MTVLHENGQHNRAIKVG